MTTATPKYDAYQSSFHEAFRPELYRLLDSLPLPADGHVLDVPCGNGFYTRRLVQRLKSDARLTAVDACEEYLTHTREAVEEVRTAGQVEVRQADAYHLPYPDASFHLVWCAQSLISLDAEKAVRELHRVTRPNGVAAVLETDEFHHVLLSWPTELEAAMPAAVHAASLRRYGDGVKLAPARRLRRVLKQGGFQAVRRTTYPIERAAPFDAATTEYLTQHFHFLRKLAYPHLPAAQQAVFDRATDPDSPTSFFRSPESELVCLNALYTARPVARTRRSANRPESPEPRQKSGQLG